MQTINYSDLRFRRYVVKNVTGKVGKCTVLFDANEVSSETKCKLQNIINMEKYSSPIHNIIKVSQKVVSPVYSVDEAEKLMYYLVFFKYNNNYQMIIVPECNTSNNFTLAQLPNIGSNRKARQKEIYEARKNGKNSRINFI